MITSKVTINCEKKKNPSFSSHLCWQLNFQVMWHGRLFKKWRFYLSMFQLIEIPSMATIFITLLTDMFGVMLQLNPANTTGAGRKKRHISGCYQNIPNGEKGDIRTNKCHGLQERSIYWFVHTSHFILRWNAKLINIEGIRFIGVVNTATQKFPVAHLIGLD